MKPISVVFFWTPALAEGILQALIEDARFEVLAVVAQPDRPGGRGHGIIEPATKQLARRHDIPCYQPEKLKKNTKLIEQLKALNVRYFVVSAYGRIMPRSILNIPEGWCFNVHYSILPEYRGATPIQWPLLDGKPATGVTLQKMVYEMDAGDIVATKGVGIDPFETSESLYQKFIDVSGSFTVDVLSSDDNGEIRPTPQDHDKATFCSKMSKQDGLLDSSKPVIESFRSWQAYTNWPGLYFFVNGKRFVIEQCSYVNTKTNAWEGTIYLGSAQDFDFPLPPNQDKPKHFVGITHNDGYLVLLVLKMEGKKSMDIDRFMDGNAQALSEKIDTVE